MTIQKQSETFLQFGATNKSLLKVSCIFAGTSAASGIALHFCTGIPLAEDDSRTFAGAFIRQFLKYLQHQMMSTVSHLKSQKAAVLPKGINNLITLN